jgi:hypothetical protein
MQYPPVSVSTHTLVSIFNMESEEDSERMEQLLYTDVCIYPFMDKKSFILFLNLPLQNDCRCMAQLWCVVSQEWEGESHVLQVVSSAQRFQVSVWRLSQHDMVNVTQSTKESQWTPTKLLGVYIDKVTHYLISPSYFITWHKLLLFWKENLLRGEVRIIPQ